ncbi:hypothetical protein [Celeribacter sp.]|uniref:hypothetical protein n=1 Tax=Celeribacter sp. TaxID=1890673 RepID=UPI003A8D72C5
MEQLNGILLFKLVCSFLALGLVGYVLALAPKWLWMAFGALAAMALTIGFVMPDTRGMLAFSLIVAVPFALPALGIGALLGMAHRRRVSEAETDFASGLEREFPDG